MTQSTSSSNKRPRRDTSSDDNRAECPFSVRIVDPREKDFKAKGKKRRKRGHSSSGNHPDDDEGNRKTLHQCAPFAPKGAFETHNTMDVHYVVEPSKQWADMTRYNSFVLNNIKYYCEGFIYVANDFSIERQKNVAPRPGSAGAGAAGAGTDSVGVAGAAAPRDSRKRSEDDWVARILEIRASDEHHVYARVFWMYWPDELPAGTHYGKRQVQGRQPYHGASELIASNHMDIINVVSVTSMASVNHLNEDKDDDVQSALYWRQALDVRNMELSSIENVCDCNQPANPDKMLVGCGDQGCAKWLHEECLKHYALMRVYERLGRDKPHIPETKQQQLQLPGAALKSESGSEDVKEPLSPQESGGAVSVQQSIDVKADTVEVQGLVSGNENNGGNREKTTDATISDSTTPRTNGSTKDVAVRHKKTDVSSPPPPTAGSSPLPPPLPLKRELTPSVSDVSSQKKGRTGVAAGTQGPATPAGKARATAGGKSGASKNSDSKRRFPTLHSFDGKKKPYDKLFEATLLLTPLESSATPTMIEIRDLRTGVTGGVKEWLEPAECPVCGSAIR